jgi:tRNA A37 methylthiotransferase MiaB
MKNVFVFVKGCSLRYLDAEKLSKYFSKNGYNVIENPKKADIIVFVTCAVFEEATEESLQKIREFQKYKAELIIAGCLPAIDKEKLNSIFKGRVIDTKELNNIDKIFSNDKFPYHNIDDANYTFKNVNKKRGKSILFESIERLDWFNKQFVKIKSHVLKYIFSEKSIFYLLLGEKPFTIRIARGCIGNCSYCVIKKAIGELVSKPLNECIKEFEKGLDLGYTYFAIDADEIGPYGTDINTDIIELLEKMISTPKNFKLSLRNFTPIWAYKYTNKLEELLKSDKIISLDIPIQSGNKRILKLMNRYTGIEKIKDTLLGLNKVNPNVALLTEYICGFPSETWDEFLETMNFIIDTNLSGFIYAYSNRSRTEAEKIEPKISDIEIKKRMTYAKKILKNNGYRVLYISKLKFFIFDKK